MKKKINKISQSIFLILWLLLRKHPNNTKDPKEKGADKMLHNNFPRSFATGARDGLMSKEDKINLESLSSNVTKLYSEVEESSQNAKMALSMAQGATTIRVFDTIDELEAWLTDENIATLKVGDTFLIRDMGSPDFWWDGEEPQVLEAFNLDLFNYVEKYSDIGTNTVEFTEDETLAEVASGSTMKTLFGSISKAIKSLIELITKIGDTDISSIGSTITEAIDNIDSSAVKVIGSQAITASMIPLMLNDISEYNTSMLAFANKAKIMGSIGFSNGYLVRASSDFSTAEEILDTGNYDMYCLPLSGGIINGSIRIAHSDPIMLRLFRTETTGDAGIQFGNAAGAYGSLLMRDGYTGLYRFDVNANYFKILDEETAGEIQLPAVGKDGYIAYPEGGSYSIKEANVTGYLTITLPQFYSYTMIKFKISIYDFEPDKSCDYFVAGYICKDSVIWQCISAYSISRSAANSAISNLPVHFGNNGGQCVVQIGNSDTQWSYPNIRISDVTIGHWGNKYEDWGSGWDVSYTITPMTTVDHTIENPANWYYANRALNDGDGNKISTTYLKTSGGTVTGKTTFTGGLYIMAASGSEGGEIVLAKPETNNVFDKDVHIDVCDNHIRFFATHNSISKAFHIDFNSNTTGNVTMVHSGNISTYALPKSGGTLTGNIAVQSGYGRFLADANHATVRAYTTPGQENAYRGLLVCNYTYQPNDKNGLQYRCVASDGTYKDHVVLHTANYSDYNLRPITKGTTDLTAGSSALATDTIYVVYK